LGDTLVTGPQFHPDCGFSLPGGRQIVPCTFQSSCRFLFFTAGGMLFEPGVLLANPGGVLLYLGVAIGLKATIVATVASLLARETLRTGVLAGAALAQTGEFSFVLAETSRSAGLLDPGLHQVVIAGSILSLLATPFLMRAAPAWIDRLSGEGARPP